MPDLCHSPRIDDLRAAWNERGRHGPARSSGWIAALKAGDQELDRRGRARRGGRDRRRVEVVVVVVVVSVQPGTLADLVVPPFRPAVIEDLDAVRVGVRVAVRGEVVGRRARAVERRGSADAGIEPRAVAGHVVEDADRDRAREVPFRLTEPVNPPLLPQVGDTEMLVMAVASAAFALAMRGSTPSPPSLAKAASISAAINAMPTMPMSRWRCLVVSTVAIPPSPDRGANPERLIRSSRGRVRMVDPFGLVGALVSNLHAHSPLPPAGRARAPAPLAQSFTPCARRTSRKGRTRQTMVVRKD